MCLDLAGDGFSVGHDSRYTCHVPFLVLTMPTMLCLYGGFKSRANLVSHFMFLH